MCVLEGLLHALSHSVTPVQQLLLHLALTNALPGLAEYDPELARTAASSTATRFGDPAPVLAAAGDAGLEGVECRELAVAFAMKADEWWCVQLGACESVGHALQGMERWLPLVLVIKPAGTSAVCM